MEALMNGVVNFPAPLKSAVPLSDLKVAYLVNQYPKVSHTFIRREILALERQGITVLRFAIRGWDAEVVDPVDEAERARTRYVLKNGIGALFGAVTKTCVRRPAAAFAALKAALAMSRHSVRPLPYHLIWFAHACQLLKWLEGEDVSHLHAHFGTNSADVAYLLRLLGGPTYSFTVHGADECDNAKRLSLPWKTAAARFVVTVSSYVRAQMMRQVPPADWRKMLVVHCGLDEAFMAAEPPPQPAEPTLLCIGRLCAEKGHLTLLDAFAALDRSGLRLVLAGDGELRNLVDARIRDLGLQDRVHVTGWIGSDAVLRLIGEATIVVQPSLMEGLPVVVMEALARGRPVVSTFIAGIPELVEDGRTGWLVPAGDAESLTRTLAQALDTPAERLVEMGKAGIARVRARHHIDTEAARLARLFAEGVP
jgi:glycosyltransferase involved in cell wall biosynthesis